jgi:molybdopterin-guanine dinucleotide biosynthesis protein A
MIAKSDITAVILAGGKVQKATGRSPCQIEIDGRKVIERQAQLLKAKVSRIELAVSAPVTWSRFPATIDDFDPIGPLAGIATALKYASTDYILVVHGGYAWINPDALDLLVGRAGDPFDACAVRMNFATPKPLLAIYHKRAAKRAADRIERGEYDAGALLGPETLSVRWIEDYEFESVDPGLTSFKIASDDGTPEIAPAEATNTPAVAGDAKPGDLLPFQALEAYKSAVSFVPIAYALAKLADTELGNHLVRAALSINLGIAEGTGAAARTSALKCVAALDAMRAVGVTDPRIADGQTLLVQIVALLDKP